MVIKQRARSSKDKQARREHLLKVALELWNENTFSSFTMNQVATRAKLAKGTTYLYFQTKEELLLALLTQELEDWFKSLNQTLEHQHSWNAVQIAEVISHSFQDRITLRRLITIQASILEHNISFEAALAFKGFLLLQAATTSQLLEQALPFLHSGEGVLILQRINALVLGLGQLAEPSEIVKTVLEQEDLKPLRVDFELQLKQTLEAMFKGLESERK